MGETACRSDEELMQVATGEEISEPVREHPDHCPSCRQRADRLQAEVTSLRAAYVDLTGTLGQSSRPDQPTMPLESAATPDRQASIGKYRVIGSLEGGGQATVYRVAHPNLPMELVVKLGRQASGTEGRDRLVAEGKILAELDHPNLARIYDLDFEGDRPFLVMEYVRGRNLRQVAQQQPFGPRQAASLIAKVARALQPAHARGVTHLDIKPDNIVIDEAGQPRVIDFGIARIQDAWADDTAGSDTISGTLGYMAPEQARGERSDGRSDVFALGATLYFLLVGHAPFTGRTAEEVLGRAQLCDFDRQALRSAGGPGAIKRVCLRAMEAEPQDRYATVAALAVDLERMVARPRRLKRAVAVAAGAVVLLAAAIGTWALVTGDREQKTEPAPPADAGDREKKTEPVPRQEHLLGRPLRRDFQLRCNLLGGSYDASGKVIVMEGQWVTFEVQAALDCYLGVWHVDDRGEFTQLFPSGNESDHRLRAGEPRIVGRSVAAVPVPEGIEFVHVAASTRWWAPEGGRQMGPSVMLAEEAVRTLDADPISDQSPGISEEIILYEVRRQEDAD